MDDDLLRRYGGPVPRYTSYPTAPHFHDRVTADDYRDWLSRLPDAEPLSVYLHVPFCNALCWYCGCHTKIVARYAPVGDYAEALAGELDLVGDAIGAARPAAHVHWGGGTPTMLSADDFERLMDTVRARFPTIDGAEVAVEIDPRTFDDARAAALARSGVTRASLGVQDFNPAVQAAINREQSFETTERVVGRLRDAGIQGLNLDLMYGLPGQTVADVERTVQLSLALQPDRVALFGYAHVPWMKRHQRLIAEDVLPGAAERAAQAEAAARRLAALGYVAVGLDHFARPDDAMAKAAAAGTLRRNFQGYTTDSAATLLGFGASAIGALPQGYVQNAVPIRDYADAVRAGRLATRKGIAVTDDDRLRRAVIERLMCALEVDIDREARPFGRTLASFAPERHRLHAMARDGLVTISGGRVRITERGRPFMRSVCAVFDQRLTGSTARHSRAV